MCLENKRKRFVALFLAVLCIATLMMSGVASAHGRFNYSVYIEKIEIKTGTFKTRYKTSAPLSENSEKMYLSFVVNIKNSTTANQSIDPRIDITTPSGETISDYRGTTWVSKKSNMRFYFTPEGMAGYYEAGTYTIDVYEDDELLYSGEVTFTGTCPSLSWTNN